MKRTGTALFTLGAVAVLGVAALMAGAGPFQDAGRLALSLGERVGWWAGALFAIALLNGSVLGAGAVTLATSYAIGDVFGVKHSLHRRWDDARVFHGSFALSLALAALVVLVPRVPLGMVTVAVQVLAGILLPSATVFLLLLANDREILGPWTNPPWLNVIAVTAVGILIEMSALLTLVTLFPGLNVTIATVAMSAALAIGLLWLWLLRAPKQTRRSRPTAAERWSWTMPPIETLARPAGSGVRTIGLTVLRGYLIVATILVVAKLLTEAAGA